MAVKWSSPKGDSLSQNAQVKTCLLLISRLNPLDDSDTRFRWSLNRTKTAMFEPDRLERLDGGAVESAADARKSAANAAKRWGGMC